MPRGFGVPPPERRCKGISKHTGQQCGNYAVKGHELCSGHLQLGVAAHSMASERRAILGPGVPPDVAEHENAMAQSEETARSIRLQALRQQQEEALEQHQREVAMIEQEKRRRAETPPWPLTEEERAAGTRWVKDFDAPDELDFVGNPKSRVPPLIDTDGRRFLWRKFTREMLMAQPVNAPEPEPLETRIKTTPHAGAELAAYLDLVPDEYDPSSRQNYLRATPPRSSKYAKIRERNRKNGERFPLHQSRR